MKQFNSTNLIKVLIVLIELQIYAVEAKRKCPASAALKYLGLGANIRKGICWNVYETPSRLPDEWENECICILDHVMKYAPSNTSGSIGYPVNSPFPGQTRGGIYEQSEAYAMWGDHPYADNRRLLIAEMIKQLQVELKARGYKL